MTTTKPTKFEQTHIAMVLDRSGSMDSCRKATIDAVNKYLLEARQDANMKEADFELLTFDSQSIDTVRTGAPLNVKDIREEDYVPRGGTPLYDAIGRGIDGLDGKLAATGSGKAVLVIVTDGQENASRKYNHGSISELVKGRQAAGWLVVFLGAGLEAAAQGAALGVRAAYTASIGTDHASLDCAMSEVAMASSTYSAAASASDARHFAETSSFSATARRGMGDASGGLDLSKLNKTMRPKSTPAVSALDTDTWAQKAPDDAWGA